MRILLLGASGMLGHKLVQRLSAQHEVIGTLRQPVEKYEAHPAFAGATLEGGVQAEDLDGVERLLRRVAPDALVNCVGLIKQKEEARQALPNVEINALLPHALAARAATVGARFVHFSTDCVFSGRQGGYTEDDLPDPPDLYGRSKLLGEVTEGGLTLRSSVIGRELVGGHGLLEWFRSRSGQDASGFRHAIYSGLTTLVMADLVEHLLVSHPELEGVWHVASEPISKYDLLVHFNEALGWGVEISPDETFRCDRSLDGSRFEKKTGWRAPSWKDMIQGIATDPTPYA